MLPSTPASRTSRIFGWLTTLLGMNTVTSLDLLTAADEGRLARRIEVGLAAEHLDDRRYRSEAERDLLIAQGRQAWRHFLLANVRLVQKVAAAEARLSGVAFEDLFQEGCLALAVALQRFDYRRGRFSTYAMQCVQRHVSEAAAGRLGALALPPSRAVRLRRVHAVAARLSQRLGREADAAEIARELGETTVWVTQLLGYRAPVCFDVTAELWQLAAPATDPDQSVLRGQLPRLLRRVPADHAEVLRRRYGLDGGEPASVESLAAILQVSPSTVRRMERHGLGLLRRWLDGEPTMALAC